MDTEATILSADAETATTASEPCVTVPLSALREITRQCELAATGDLEARITHLADHPELGRLTLAINAMLDIADSFVRESAAAMSHCSEDKFFRPILLRGLHGAYRQSSATINQAGLKMKESSEQLALVANMAADNTNAIGTVAAACEELHATSSEISRQSSESASLTSRTVAQSQEANQSARGLSSAVDEIDGIVALIKKVAGQTNLLALNATIEAARAGEHGRGFAVVANEVKELSRTTAKATDGIRQQVDRMKASVVDVESGLNTINDSIGQIDKSVNTIAVSVEDQVKATNEISRSIHQVSENTSQVADRIHQSRP